VPGREGSRRDDDRLGRARLHVLRETLDAIKGVADIISSFPIGGGGDLGLSSAVTDCFDLLDLPWLLVMGPVDDNASTTSRAHGGGREEPAAHDFRVGLSKPNK
jgi:hypothetical protein